MNGLEKYRVDTNRAFVVTWNKNQYEWVIGDVTDVKANDVVWYIYDADTSYVAGVVYCTPTN